MRDSSTSDRIESIQEALTRCEVDEQRLRDLLDELREAPLDVESAARVATAANALSCKSGLPSTKAAATLHAARAACVQADYISADKGCSEALAIFTELADQVGVANCEILRGAIASETGDHVTAASAYRRAERGFRAVGDHGGIAACAYNRGLIHVSRSELHEARACFESAEEDFRALGQGHKAAICHMNLGYSLDQSGRHEEALEAYLAARQEFETHGDQDRAARCLMNAGRAFADAGRHQRAIQMFRDAATVFQLVSNARLQAACLLNEAEASQGVASHHDQKSALVRALRIFNRLRDQAGLAESRLALGSLVGSRKFVSRSLAGFERLGNKLRAAEAEGVLASLSVGSEEAVHLERALSKVDDAIATNPDPSVRFSARDKFAKLGYTLAGISIATGDLESAWSHGTRAKFSNRQDSPLAVPDGSVAIQYVPVGEAVHILVSSGQALTAFVAPLDRPRIAGLCLTANAELSQPGREDCDSLRELYDALVLPWKDILATARRIVFIPPDELGSVPYTALQSADKRYLVETHEIELTTGSTSEFRLDQTRQGLVATQSEFPPVWTSLPTTESEGMLIESLLPFVTRLHGSRAVVGDILGQLPSASWAHLGTHAVVNSHNPLASAFVFQPDESHPSGMVYAREIAELQTQCGLVTLSACETGERSQSLAHAFLHSGTERVIASAWRAHDEATGLWMSTFFKALASGATIAAAHRLSCFALLQSPFKAPHYWAPWKLLG